ncbi:DUF1289 domain-containing protein [Vibrio sp. SCSIO 43137]|uniref:DUF1289 domain-containing protein n=1 Tax=Vibrio sp. SCSIO 43137 TaxID=3021011 RepID=UPI00230740FC|nr:DUF1289 domain-containing protein [Vibrio sp. SCSIO 43137]WCE30985.1 DUF1289 domain-containing protein [Vibrio sp. SCSIO 43137]
MKNPTAKGEESQVESPCIRHCCLDEQDICVGCFRSLDEIINWSASNNSQRQQILERCLTRQQKT